MLKMYIHTQLCVEFSLAKAAFRKLNAYISVS